jgi:hypothetical protein
VPTVLDAGGQPVSAVLTWTSSAPAIADVSGSGLVTAFAAGDVVITASADNGTAGTAAIHVNAGPPPSASPVRFNEIHYDNVGVDSGEAIEIEGPAGTDVTGYRIVLYNGNGGTPYNTQTLSGVLPSTCDGRGVLFVTYPLDGIQNGAPDGMRCSMPRAGSSSSVRTRGCSRRSAAMRPVRLRSISEPHSPARRPAHRYRERPAAPGR